MGYARLFDDQGLIIQKGVFMFLFHVAFSLNMLALCAGTAVYIWSDRNNGAGSSLAKIIGTLVILFSVISIFCTVYFGMRYWAEGYYDNPMMMSRMQMQRDMTSNMSDKMSSNMTNKQMSTKHH